MACRCERALKLERFSGFFGVIEQTVRRAEPLQVLPFFLDDRVVFFAIGLRPPDDFFNTVNCQTDQEQIKHKIEYEMLDHPIICS